MHLLSKWDGRWLVALAILAYFGMIFEGARVSHLSRAEIWRDLGMNAMDLPFVDLSVVVQDSANREAGVDPWQQFAIHDIQHVNNYPWPWGYAGKLGLNANTLEAFGVGIGIAFFATTLFVLGKLSLGEGAWASLVVVSPCIMLGPERGNVDLVIFILLGVCFALRRLIPASLLVLTAGVILKMFPIFGLLAFFAPPWRKTLPWLAAVVFLCLIYFVCDHSELQRIGSLTPHNDRESYGGSALFMTLLRSNQTGWIVLLADVVLAVVLAVFIWLSPESPDLANQPWWHRELFAFRLGAGIFIGTFGLGTNWDYRTVFLLFCLPLLFQLWRGRNSLQPWSIVALALLLLYFHWNTFSEEAGLRHRVIRALLTWGLVGTLGGILAATWNVRSQVMQRLGVSSTQRYPQSKTSLASPPARIVS